MQLPLWPEAASAVATDVDHLYIYLTVVSVVMSVLIFGTIFVFAIKYRRARRMKLRKPIHGSLRLEITWSVIPFLVMLTFFWWGAKIYFLNATPPPDSMDVYVVGKQWMWKLQYPEGQREINELHVPIGRPVKITLASEDVIHSFFIPALRIKHDVVPGHYDTMWFTANKPGRYHLFCAEYCGTEHSGMVGWVTVMEPADYENWLAGGGICRHHGAAGRAPVRAVGLLHLPPAGSPGPLPDFARRVWVARATGRRQNGAGRRRLHSRVDPESQREGRGRI